MKRHDPIYGTGYDYPPMIINPYSFASAGGGAFEIAATSRYESSSSATSHSITMPTGTAIGDLLIVGLSMNSDTTVTEPSGWNVVTVARAARMFWKVAASGDTGSLAWTLAASRTAGLIAIRITGQHASDPLAAVSAASANPPNLAPGWGTGDFLGITLFAQSNSASASGTITPPSGTTLGVQSPPNSSSTVAGVVFSASQSLTSVSSWDPAAWGASAFSGSATWTILVRPA